MSQVSYDNSHIQLYYYIHFPTAPSDPVQNVMVSNITSTEVNNISVFITWDPPTDPNGIIRYYRVQYIQASDPLANTGFTGGRKKRNIALDTTTILNEIVNITDGGVGPRTSITLRELG